MSSRVFNNSSLLQGGLEFQSKTFLPGYLPKKNSPTSNYTLHSLPSVSNEIRSNKKTLQIPSCWKTPFGLFNLTLTK